MDTHRSTTRTDPTHPGGLSNRAIIGSGIAGGVVLAIASMFWAAPERAVQRTTGIGVERRTVEQEVQWRLRRAQYQEAIDILLQHLRLRETSERRIAYYICALVLAGQPDRAREEIDRWVCARPFGDALRDASSASDAAPSAAFDTPAFLEGEWELRDENGLVTDLCRIERLCEGRAYLELRRGRMFANVAIFLVDPENGQWTRVLLSRNGTMAAYRGALADGELRVEGSVRRPDDGLGQPLRMIFRPCADGTIEWLYEEQTGDGAWRVTSVQTYTPVSGLWDADPS